MLMTNELVVGHYSKQPALADLLLERLHQEGKLPGSMTTKEFTGIDQLHVRGRQAVLELATAMKLKPNQRVLDIGSGLGGPARTIAENRGCHITGIDLTSTYNQVATMLSRLTGLTAKTSFTTGDATQLPFGDDSFDAAISLHTSMNIAAKSDFFSEVNRVLKPGRLFGLYDILRGEGGDPVFPVPWAHDPAISHLLGIGQLTELLEANGFAVQAVMDSTQDSEVSIAQALEKTDKPQPFLSVESILGEDASDMANNLARNLAERRVRTVTCIARTPVT